MFRDVKPLASRDDYGIPAGMSRMLAIVVALAACGGSAPAPVPAKPDHPAAPSDPTCPLEVPGTSVAVEDRNNGAALLFVTTGNVDEVRARAKRLADAVNQHAAPAGSLAAMMPQVEAIETDLDYGASV